MDLLLIVSTPVAGCLALALATRLGRGPSAWLAGGVSAVSLALLLSLASRVFAGEVVVAAWPWLPSLGLNFSLRLDGLGFLFAVLILGIGLLVILYARYYLSERDSLRRLYALLLAFMGSMLGVVLAENLLLLVVFWELTSLTSFLLIGYWQHQREARRGARMALAVTGAGGLALLAGVLLLGAGVGSFEMSDVLAAGDAIRGGPLYLPTLVLILAAAFTKSAQFPFHFWLPSAMAAPTPVSAYLHSATMVKAGVFLLARLFPILSGTEVWFFVVGGTGLATLLFAAYTALFKHDIKGLLAYSTISHLGLITLLFGLGTRLGAVAGVFHIMNHATFKASLFMAAGIIEHETGSRDMRQVNGLFKFMPYTGLLAMVAASAMAGVPLLNGFLSKEMFFAETVNLDMLGELHWTLPIAATLAGIFSVAYSVRFIHDVFFNGDPIGLARTPHEPPRWMKIPVEILVALCLLVGLFPAWAVGPLLATAVVSTLNGPLPSYDLALWHGFGAPLAMSIVAMAGGVIVYSQRRHLFGFHDRRLPVVSAAGAYQVALAGVIGLAAAITKGLQNNSLQRYMFLLLTACVAAALLPLWQQGSVLGAHAATPVDGVSLAAWLVLIVASAATVVLSRARVAAIVMLSIVGLVVTLAFVRFSAPDLALTQLCVEVVTTILLLLTLYFLPQSLPPDSLTGRRLRDAGLAVLAGAATAALVWAVLTRPQQTLSGYYIANSLPEGGGRNVVNVILVDFRGFDTLGEILVLSIAALCIHAMVRGLQVPHAPTAPGGRSWSADRYPLIMATITRPLLPFALLVSLYLLLRGHNQPGGGFIAGLVTSVALIMQYLASGIRWTQQRLHLKAHLVIAAGVLGAALTGLVSLGLGAPFLTSAFGHFSLPVVGELELASAMAFDLGVYLAVVGAVLLILASIGRVSQAQEVSQRPRVEGVSQWRH